MPGSLPNFLPFGYTRCSKCGGAEFPGGSGCSCDSKARTALETRCGELEAQLCGQLVEHPGRKAMLLVLAELRRAKLKHPHLAINEEEALVVLASEFGELSTAILRRDVHGKHGMIREAAHVAAVAIRIIEYCMGEVDRADA